MFVVVFMYDSAAESFWVRMSSLSALVRSSLKVSSGAAKVGVVKLEIKLPL